MSMLIAGGWNRWPVVPSNPNYAIILAAEMGHDNQVQVPHMFSFHFHVNLVRFGRSWLFWPAARKQRVMKITQPWLLCFANLPSASANLAGNNKARGQHWHSILSRWYLQLLFHFQQCYVWFRRLLHILEPRVANVLSKIRDLSGNRIKKGSPSPFLRTTVRLSLEKEIVSYKSWS